MDKKFITLSVILYTTFNISVKNRHFCLEFYSIRYIQTLKQKKHENIDPVLGESTSVLLIMFAI